MKKFLITISPLCMVLFALMWFSWGLKGAFAFFGAVLFIVALVFGLMKWTNFVDKHIKDTLNFIDSLLKESASEPQVKESAKTQHVNETCKENSDSLTKEPVSEDLEEAAKHYLYSNILYDDVYVGNPTDKDCIEMFKAGANWQKQQMVNKAFSVEIGKQRPDYRCVLNGNFFKYDTGDKVKVLIIKED